MAVTLLVSSNAIEVGAALEALGPAAQARLAAVTRSYAALGLGMVKAKASTGFHAPGEGHIPGTGPGPNVATGDYLRSMSVEPLLAPGVVIFSIGTNAKQAMRLEHGFVGVDAAGRHFPGNPPTGASNPEQGYPYPHWGPMADELEPLFVAGVEASLAEITGGV